MTPPLVPVDKSVMVGSIYESDQEVTLPGIVTHTRSRALRTPCWVLVICTALIDPLEALRAAVGALL